MTISAFSPLASQNVFTKVAVAVVVGGRVLIQDRSGHRLQEECWKHSETETHRNDSRTSRTRKD